MKNISIIKKLKINKLLNNLLYIYKTKWLYDETGRHAGLNCNLSAIMET